MAELSVSRKNISKLLSEMQGRKFIIPDYQRPYKWDEEKCETLWNDITSFHFEKKDNDEYFLGTIVTCKSDENKQNIEIIDGQQRITSILLLLRAFYKKLENMPEDVNVIGLKSQIAPCIWDVNPISRIVEDLTKIHIESKVTTESNNDIFHRILYEGIYDENNRDLFTTNYKFFFNKCEEFARDNPTQWQPLCVTILEKCIVLPIECENIDTGLTIFSTLNDRGLPLSDSDIFKAQIYKTKKTPNEKRAFADKWKELSEIVDDAKLTLDDIFRYYSHILRAKNKNNTKEIGLRKFYSENNYSLLREQDIVDDLFKLAYFWFAVNTRQNKIDDREVLDLESQKYLHCLQTYPNEYWKYITSVYYYKNKDSDNFNNNFTLFLKRLIAFLFVKFIEKPTVNAIKDDIYQGCIDVYHYNSLNYQIEINESFKELIGKANNLKIAKSLILLKAYLNGEQNDLIPYDFEIEHIFPRIWQNTNYNGWSKEEADEYLEKFGNKIAIEKKLNIQAGNGYFGRKKEKYKNSKIAEVLKLGNYNKNDWIKEDIAHRENEFQDAIFNFFKLNLSTKSSA